MRRIKSLSPSALALWEWDREQFYIKRLAECRPPWEPQSKPGAAGSAFDYLVKQELVGDQSLNVDPALRPWALEAGRHLLAEYKRLGVFAEVAATVSAADRVICEDSLTGDVDGVPITGKPDLIVDGLVLDWKVRGYCGNYTTSPSKGWLRLYDATMTRHGTPGLPAKYHDQTTFYHWLAGCPGPSEIHELCCKPGDPRPAVRVAVYCDREHADDDLRRRLTRAWDCITSGHIFDELSRTESDDRCAHLERVAAHLEADDFATEWRKRKWY